VQFGALPLMVGAKTLRGCVYGSTDPARDFSEIVRLQQAGHLDLEALVTRRIELDELNDAFRAMQAGEVARSIIVY
jgi:S-(hydroxymethyl)glutathione dehydrogenase/alcohol dehydrogenase